ncbi:transposase, ISL3 family domain protein [Klebsiella oxytoca]|nr:transposase, ISL3 family domain protein [Klebsiella oxytoca]
MVVVNKTCQNEYLRLQVESHRQAKSTRVLWQYSDRQITKSR